MQEQAIRDGVRGFNVRRRQGGDTTLEVVECRAGTLSFTVDDDVRVELRWPLDSESVWFVVEPEWVASVVNEETLSGRITTMQPLLAKICEVVDRAQAAELEAGASDASLLQSAQSLGASSAGLELSLSGSIDRDISDGRHFQLTAAEFQRLATHVEEAQDVLGADRVKLVHELGTTLVCACVSDLGIDS